MAKAISSWKDKWEERKRNKWHATNCYLVAYPNDRGKYCTCKVIYPD